MIIKSHKINNPNPNPLIVMGSLENAFRGEIEVTVGVAQSDRVIKDEAKLPWIWTGRQEERSPETGEQ